MTDAELAECEADAENVKNADTVRALIAEVRRLREEKARALATAEEIAQRYFGDTSALRAELDAAIALAAQDVVSMTEHDAITESPLYRVRKLFIERVQGAWAEKYPDSLADAARRAGEEVDEFKRLLSEMKHGDCWCEVGIGNPMMRGHSTVCLKVTAMLAV